MPRPPVAKVDLDAALKNLSLAVDEVKRFVAGTRNQTAELYSL